MPDVSDKPTTFNEALGPLTARQKAFVKFYLGLESKDGHFSTWNAAKSARFADYKAKSDVIGAQNLGNLSIKTALELGMKEMTQGRDELLKRVDEVAKGSMEDFITLEEVEYREPVTMPAFKYREQLRSSLADALEQLESSGEEDKQPWEKLIGELEQKIDELPSNPAELVSVPGEVKRQTVARIDLVKAEKAGKLGLIRKMKQTDKGLEVELHDSMRALELLGKHYKLWSDRVTLENPDGTPIKFIAGVGDEDL
jgi:phage terminase small subunit